MIGIYKITNKKTGKSYIGQSIDIERRIEEHIKAPHDKSNSSYALPLQQDIRSEGKEAFEFQILEECAKEELNEKEHLYIEEFNSYLEGYNNKRGNTPKTPTEPDYVKVYIEAMILTLGKGRQFSSETNLLFAMAKRMTYANSEMPMVVGMTGLVKKAIAEETGMSISFIDKTLTNLKKKDLIRSVSNERGYYQIDPRIFGRGNYKDIYSLQVKWTADTYERSVVSSTEE